MVSENQPGEMPARARAVSTGSAGFLMLGALIIVGGHILFGLILNEFGFGVPYVAISVLALMAIYGMGGANFVGARGQKFIGYFMGIVGVLFLLSDIRSGFPSGVLDNIANIVFYAGCLLMFLGARGLES
ncbi:MAG TPA: hypothetical protein VLA54_06825 [Acidimicrobiia bacterium]|jgi:hypothetical protein|nr:hypothetical protein [Acidimicrobiia bacterium]